MLYSLDGIFKGKRIATNNWYKKKHYRTFEKPRKTLSHYFPDTDNDIDWIQNPFVNKKKLDTLTVLEYENLIKIKSMSSLKHKFESGSLNEF